MFERFSEAARAVVVGAQTEARSLGHPWIGTEHLLLAVLAVEGAPVPRALAGLGLTHDAVRTEVLRELGSPPVDDGAALRDLGIDLDAVRRRVEERFGPGALDAPVTPARRRRWRLGRGPERRRVQCGPGHIPFTGRAKKSLELGLREAEHLHSREIGVPHLMLGVLRAEGLALLAVTRLGVSPADVRVVLLDQLGRAA
jgi:ATP-dependent Clp protease ATP-binding subunit ClpA